MWTNLYSVRMPDRNIRDAAKSHHLNAPPRFQTDGWKNHKAACKARKRKKLDYSNDKMLIDELLSVAMRGGGHKGVLGTILSYVW